MCLTDAFLAGRLKAACDLIAHHLPPNVKAELMSAYEYVIPSLKFSQDITFLAVSRPWKFTYKLSKKNWPRWRLSKLIKERERAQEQQKSRRKLPPKRVPARSARPKNRMV